MEKLNPGMRLAQWAMCLAMLLAGSCSSDNNPDEPEPPSPGLLPIKLSCSISAPASRATDTAFETGDRIGLYVANYAGSTPPILQTAGNHVDNMPFSYSGNTWTSQSSVYWEDDTTPADFYAYFPYASTVADITAYPAEIKTNQSTASAHDSSNALWGKTAKQKPTASAVHITLAPLFSRIVVNLTAGKGFTTTDLADADIQVVLNNAHHKAILNLAQGTATPTGGSSDIRFLRDSDGQSFRAWVVPQDIALHITVTINGNPYTIEQEFSFESGKQHSFTLTVDKNGEGLQVDITGWETDNIDYGGTVG